MKKIALILSLSLLVFSCSKDESSDDSGMDENSEVNESVISKEDLIGKWTLISSNTEGASVVDDANCDLQDNLTFTQDQFIVEDYYNIGDNCFSFDPSVSEYFIQNDELRIVEGIDGIISSLWGDLTLEEDLLTVKVLLFSGLENVRVFKKE